MSSPSRMGTASRISRMDRRSARGDQWYEGEGGRRCIATASLSCGLSVLVQDVLDGIVATARGLCCYHRLTWAINNHGMSCPVSPVSPSADTGSLSDAAARPGCNFD